MTPRAASLPILVALLAPGAGLAAPRETPAAQAEWAQDYAAPASQRVERSSSPLLSGQVLSASERAVEDLASAVSSGGWPRVQGVEGLRLGARSPAVADLRRRLAASGDLEPGLPSSQVYDSYVQAAVRRFQARHGLGATGAMGPATMAAMNVPAATRLAQLRINVQRLRSYQGDLGRRYVVVNIPAAMVETVEDEQVFTRHAAGVGKVDRQSPVMNAKVTEVNLNPYWHVPASIIRKDLVPKMQKNPSYLTDNKIHAYDGEREVPSSAINWFSDEATRYRFRQEPGAEVNSMGFVRINIPNPDGVYMHDTPSKGVFGEDFRFVSSGCVRVQNVRAYVEWLLRETPGWDPQRIAQAIASGERVDARLVQPVPVYWTYVTAWATPDGSAQFRDDIYGKDANSAAYQAELGAPPAGAPSQVAAPRPDIAAAPARSPGVVFVPLARPEPVAEALPPRPPADVGGAPDEPGYDPED